MTPEEKAKAVSKWYDKRRNSGEFQDYIDDHNYHLQLCWYVALNFVTLNEKGIELVEIVYDRWLVELESEPIDE
jgi:hypothetical protein